MQWVYCKGAYIDGNTAAVSVADRGFTHGDGVFETIRVTDGVPLFLEKHLQRMAAGAQLLKIAFEYSCNEIKIICKTLLQKNNLTDARLKIILTRGVPQKASGLPRFNDLYKSTLVVTIMPFPDKLPDSVRLITSDIRVNHYSPLCAIKSLSYLENLLARDQAHAQGGDEAMLLNTEGNVAECSMSNIFVVRLGAVTTPPVTDGALPGITAGVLSEHVQQLTLNREDIYCANEVFVTNSISGITPVVEIDKKPVGTGAPGPVTLKLQKQYATICAEYVQLNNRK